MSTRTLRFPADRSVGRVEYRTGDRMVTLDARSDVEIPPDKRVRIVLTANVRDLCFDDVDPALVASVFLQHRKLGSDLLRRLTRFTGLLELQVMESSITDHGLAALGSFPHLQVLRLHRTRVTDAGVAEIARLRELTSLDLSHTRIDGSCLEHVGKLHRLKRLDLQGTRLEPKYLRHIAHLDELTSIFLSGTSVGDDDLEHLSHMRRLRTLVLTSTKVTARGLVRLPDGPNLNVILPVALTPEEVDQIGVLRPDLIVNGRRRRALPAAPITGARQRTITPVSEDRFEEEVLGSEIPVLVDFWADWCMPCKQLDPVIDEVAMKSAGLFKVAKVDVEAAASIKDRYGIMSIPVLMLFVAGEEVLRFSARTSADILNELRTTLGVARP